MDNRDEVKAFLSSRRARISPEQAGLSAYSRNRRVPGLKRSEVADLAGVSVEYYAQLERGNLAGVSDGVLDALARALQLDDAERTHLMDLARTAGPAARTRRRTPAHQVRPTVRQILDLLGQTPATVINARMDVLLANPLGKALFRAMFEVQNELPNHARFTFLEPRAKDFWVDWESAADDCVAALRAEAGRDPYDKRLSDLVGELSTRSEPFRERWAAHNVRIHHTGLKHIHHPVVGSLHISYDVLHLPADPGLTVKVYTAAPGSADEDALRLLASWSTSHQDVDESLPSSVQH